MLDKVPKIEYNASTLWVTLTMEHIELGGKKYPRVVIHWMDIVGDCTTVGKEDVEELTCALIITEGYLYDTFEQSGTKYIRTFASYEPGQKPTFGDRNVFPLSVLTKESREVIKKALKFKEESSPDV